MRQHSERLAEATFLVTLFAAGMLLRWLLLPPANYTAYDELGYSWIAGELIKSGFVPLPQSSFVILSNGGYFFAFKPPLLVYLLAITYSVAGQSLQAGRIMVAAVGLLALLPLYFLARALFNVKIAILSSLIFVFLPVDVVIGSLITPTAISGTFATTAVYWLYKESVGGKPLLLTSLFLFLSLLTEVWGLLVIGLIMLMLIQSRGKSPSISLKNILLVLLAMIPFLVVVVLPIEVAKSVPLVSHAVSGQNFASALSYNAAEVAHQLITPDIIPGVIPLLSIVGIAFLMMRRRKTDIFLLLVILVSVFTLIVGATLSGGIATTGRYFIPFTPYISILSAVGVYELAGVLVRLTKNSDSPSKGSRLKVRLFLPRESRQQILPIN